MDRLQAHLSDPDSLGVAMGRVTTEAIGGFFVILYHKDRAKHRTGRGSTLEAALMDCDPVLPDIEDL